MFRRVPTVAILAALVFSGLLSSTVSADTALPLPKTMAAVGDSISQAASTGGSLGADYPQNSWSTGTNSTVNSHYLRLLALGAPISGQNNNLSVSGAKAAGLNAQMWNVLALEPQPDYLTVQIGGNDLCTDTFDAMTSVDDFYEQFKTAMTTLKSGSPDTYVYVVSIPDAYQLWTLFHNDWWARFIWSAGGVCQSLLANPTSTQEVDKQRRLDVRQRNIDYNTQLAAVCNEPEFVERCHFDGNAVFNTQLAKSDIAGDYFHPSIAGQAKLASVSWSVGYAWATTPPATQSMWIGGLTSSTTASRNSWTATVRIAVTSGAGSVSGVAVVGAWSKGTGATSCTTGPDGTCTVKSSSLSKKSIPSVTFTVSGLTKTDWTYDSTHTGSVSSITVTKP
jgi:lysophospholipase L1-like esterase